MAGPRPAAARATAPAATPPEPTPDQIFQSLLANPTDPKAQALLGKLGPIFQNNATIKPLLANIPTEPAALKARLQQIATAASAAVQQTPALKTALLAAARETGVIPPAAPAATAPAVTPAARPRSAKRPVKRKAKKPAAGVRNKSRRRPLPKVSHRPKRGRHLQRWLDTVKARRHGRTTLVTGSTAAVPTYRGGRPRNRDLATAYAAPATARTGMRIASHIPPTGGSTRSSWRPASAGAFPSLGS